MGIHLEPLSHMTIKMDKDNLLVNMDFDMYKDQNEPHCHMDFSEEDS